MEPTEIRYDKAAKTLTVSFTDGKSFTLSAEFLRVHSPSAEVQGHTPAERKVVSGRRHVGIIGIEPVGNYAVKLVFDDLHDSGLYSWHYLYHLGMDHDALWRSYLNDLATRNLTREP